MSVPPLEQELSALEDWLDSTEEQLYDLVSTVEARGGNLLDEQLVQFLTRLKGEYTERGFLKRRVQEGMEDWKALRPYAGAVYATLREKNNTVMNFVRYANFLFYSSISLILGRWMNHIRSR